MAKSTKKSIFSSSPLSLGKKTEKSSTQPVKKSDDVIKMANIPSKDKIQSRGSKPTAGISRQRLKTVKSGNSQSGSPDQSPNRNTENIANQNSTDSFQSNQKLKKKFEDANKTRSELLERSQSKQDKVT